MISENGAGVVKEVLIPGEMTIFPAASLHMMMNIGKSSESPVLMRQPAYFGRTKHAP